MNICLQGYNGERVDPTSGVLHPGMGYRTYSPVLMCFNDPDSLSPFGRGGINPYVWCAGDPVNRADPSGHMTAGSLFGLIAGLIGGGMLSVFTAGLSLPTIIAIDAVFAVALTATSMAIDHQYLNRLRVQGWVMLLAGSVLFSVGGAAMSNILVYLKSTSNLSFGGLMMRGGSSMDAMMARNGIPVGFHPEYQVHALGFAAEGTVSGYRIAFATSSPEGVIKICMHGRPGKVGLAHEYGGNLDGIVRAADLSKILSQRIPELSHARSVELAICYSADEKSGSIMSAVLDCVPRGVSVTGIRGEGGTTNAVVLDPGGTGSDIFAELDIFEKNNPGLFCLGQYDQMLLDERRGLPADAPDPFFLTSPADDINNNHWVQITRL